MPLFPDAFPAVQDTVTAIVDTVYLPAQTAAADSVYLEILAKTNQQLSLWGNPYGIAVGILTAFLAVLAIITAVVIWWLNKGHREQLDQKVAEYRGIIDDQIREFRDELKEQLATAQGEQRERIEAKLSELEQRREHLYRPNLSGIGRFLVESEGATEPTRPEGLFGVMSEPGDDSEKER